MLTALALIAALGWAWLLVGRAGFWKADQHLPPPRAVGARVVAVVPARDEAAVVASTVASLLRQQVEPPLEVVLVDDQSSDGTAAIARATADALGAGDRLTVVAGTPRRGGWAGKVWAMAQGVAAAEARGPDWLLLTDADIVHRPETVRALLTQAEASGAELVSLMVRLHCRTAAEKLLVPAFVFFFQKLFPFPEVNDPRRDTAAAAGGCILVRPYLLARAGGFAAMRGALIDDCTLAARLKPHAPIWLGLAAANRPEAVSVRPYDGVADVWRMVARSAFTQLRHSPSLLAGTVLGMLLLYAVPPTALLLGHGAARVFGALAWAGMAWACRPTLRHYGLGWPWALSLPAAGILYALMTLDSARRHWLGRGGAWKGRLAFPRTDR